MCGSCSASSGSYENGLRVQQNWDGNGPYIGCCVQSPGYYCIWDDVAIALECEEWVESCNFRNVLRQISHISFQVVSERDRARTALNNLARSAPFEMCKRFPLGKSYVNISCSTYAEMLQRILGALDFKDRESEKEMKYSVKREQEDKDQTARRNYSVDDASVAFRKGLMTLQNELCKRNETYTRWSFEKKYDLKWCEGPCPSPSPGGEPPNLPTDQTYNDFMKFLKAQGKDPADFDVFTEQYMKTNQFKCGWDHESLSPSVATKKIPTGVSRVYIFTSGEYAKCGSENVTGYYYSPDTKVLYGPVVLNPVIYSDDVADFVAHNYEEIRVIMRDRQRSKYPNSKFGKQKVVEDNDLSGSSFEEVDG